MHRLLTGPLTVEHLTFPIRDLPASLAPFRIVHLTDFHYDGLCLSDGLLQRAIAQANAAEPDLIALTGDFVTKEPEPAYALAAHLSRLQSRLGSFAVLGNHDHYYPNAQRIVTKALTKYGIQVLWNDVVFPLGDALPIVGMPDFWSHSFCADPIFEQLQQTHPHRPRLVLSHNPDSADVLKKWRVDLQLSGHTHGGQIVIPRLGNPQRGFYALRRRLPRRVRRLIPYMRSPECHRVVRHWEWAQGFHTVGSNQLYVNRGLGTYPPGRLFCPPEVAILDLVPAEMPAEVVVEEESMAR